MRIQQQRNILFNLVTALQTNIV